MRLILNVIWLIFGGLWLALGYFLAGIICFILIITIPFGFAAFRIGVYALWPFGYTVVDKPGPRPGALIGNVIWLVAVRDLAGDRSRDHCGRDGDHHHRHPAGAGQPQADPGVAPARSARRSCRNDAVRTGGCARMTATNLGLPSLRSVVVSDGARHGPAARHVRPRRDGPAGVADRPLQPAVHLLHARRGPGLAARRRSAQRVRTGPADDHRGHPARHHQRPLHRRRAPGVASSRRGASRRPPRCVRVPRSR